MIPDAQLRAGHIPADAYRQGVTQVVVIESTAARYVGPAVLILLGSVGSLGLVLALLALLDVAREMAAAVSAAAPAGVGVSIALRRRG